MSAGSLAGCRVAWCVSRLRKLLQRGTSSHAFIPQVDGLRFYAIYAVLIFHCTAHLMAPEKTHRQKRSLRAALLTLPRQDIRAWNFLVHREFLWVAL